MIYAIIIILYFVTYKKNCLNQNNYGYVFRKFVRK